MSVKPLRRSKMFVGGFVPGITIGLILMTICYFYAKKHDIDYGGTFDIKDVTCIQKHIVESDIIPKENFALCDIDKNNSIDIKDATKLQLIIAGAK